MSSQLERGLTAGVAYLVPDDSSELRVNGEEEQKEVLVTYKNTRYCGVRLNLESLEGDVNPEALGGFVEKLVDLCELSNPNLVETCNIIYSASQRGEGVVPTIVIFPLESKSMKTLNETAYSLDQLTLAKTLSDVSRVLKLLHSKGYWHENIDADHIYQDSVTKDYCLHPMHLIDGLLQAQFASSVRDTKGQSGEACGEKRDMFQFANMFRKMFLDYPSISTLLSCSITYILEDCLKPDPAQRPTAGRVSDALDGIIMGFNSMQLEIERLRKIAATITASKTEMSAPLIPQSARQRNSFTETEAKQGVMKGASRSIPIAAVHEKRSNTNPFDRALQIFKSKLQEGMKAEIWEYDYGLEGEEVEVGIEMEEKLLTFTPVVKSLYAFIAGTIKVGNVDFRHIVECWAGAPPDVLNEDNNNDLNFLSMALENNHEQRQITLRFSSMDLRDEMLMGIRNMVAVTTMHSGDNESLHLNGADVAGEPHVNADLNDDSMGDIYPDEFGEEAELAGPGSFYGGSLGMTNPMAARVMTSNSSAAAQKQVNITVEVTSEGGVDYTENPLARRK